MASRAIKSAIYFLDVILLLFGLPTVLWHHCHGENCQAVVKSVQNSICMNVEQLIHLYAKSK